MSLPKPEVLGQTDRPIRRAVRRMRWFQRSFEQQVEMIGQASGVRYAVRSDRLAHVFVEWLRAFEAHKPASETARRAYVSVASGLMLKQLLKHQPVRVVSVPPDADSANPAYYWPEGYAYVAYCLNVRAAVLAQDFDEALTLAPDLSQIRTWWSFRENVADDPSLAAGFLDLFSGEPPKWQRFAP